jgi:hypothetical protein
MRVLDLFAGTKGWSSAFEERGHDVVSVELEPDFPGITITGDVRDLRVSDLPWRPDIILASPPCTSFSMMTVGRNWTHDGQPRTPKAELGRDLVLATVRLIAELAPAYYLVENPRARLRSLGFLDRYERRTIWQCRYGRPYAKPTDLWGGFPPSLTLRPSCQNGNKDHVAAPRGSTTGVQGGKTHSWYTLPEAFGAQFWSPERKAASRAVAAIPYELSLEVCLAAERDSAVGAMPWVGTLWDFVA